MPTVRGRQLPQILTRIDQTCWWVCKQDPAGRGPLLLYHPACGIVDKRRIESWPGGDRTRAAGESANPGYPKSALNSQHPPSCLSPGASGAGLQLPEGRPSLRQEFPTPLARFAGGRSPRCEPNTRARSPAHAIPASGQQPLTARAVQPSCLVGYPDWAAIADWRKPDLHLIQEAHPRSVQQCHATAQPGRRQVLLGALDGGAETYGSATCSGRTDQATAPDTPEAVPGAGPATFHAGGRATRREV